MSATDTPFRLPESPKALLKLIEGLVRVHDDVRWTIPGSEPLTLDIRMTSGQTFCVAVSVKKSSR